MWPLLDRFSRQTVRWWEKFGKKKIALAMLYWKLQAGFFLKKNFRRLAFSHLE